MLIPYNTDAPLYHPPFATIGLIVLNTLLFVPVFAQRDPYAMKGDDFQAEQVERDEGELGRPPDEFPPFDQNEQTFDQRQQQEVRKQLEALQQRQGGRSGAHGPAEPGRRRTTALRWMTVEFGKFRPWQWLTANYMHGDLFHLLGNMFVLWGFGLVVEGKVGWWRFLLAYNGIGIVGWGFVQCVMILADEGIGLGASLAIFGIVAMALVWAPANEMQCVLFFGIRPIMFEASIMAIAAFALFLQVAISLFHIVFITNMGLGLRITSEILHLIGAFLGLGIGIVMLKRHWVDCENWDMFSVWAGKNTKTIGDDRQDVNEQIERIKRAEKQQLAARNMPPVAGATVDAQQRILLSQFHELVRSGQALPAWTTYQRGAQQFPSWQVSEPDFVRCISLLRNQQQWELTAAAMQEYLNRYSERETLMRLALAQLYLQQLHRPRDAAQLLQSINAAFLDEQQRAMYEQLLAAMRT